MKRSSHRRRLCLCVIIPVISPAHIEASSNPTSASRDAVQDRPVDALFNDLLGRHRAPTLHPTNLKARPVSGYGANPRIVQ